MTKYFLKNSVESVHEGKNFECPYCNTSFVWQVLLGKHLLRKNLQEKIQMWFLWKSIFPNTWPSECAHWISHPETLNERTISHNLTQCKVRAATKGKTANTAVLPGFCKVEHSGSSEGGRRVQWYGCLACLKSTVVALIEGWRTLILFSIVRLLKKEDFHGSQCWQYFTYKIM